MKEADTGTATLREIKATRAEVRRLTALTHRPWASSTGPKTAQGKRRAAANAHKHGVESAAFGLAVAYADAVSTALSRAR